jgi:hypothetical protein
VFPKEGSQGPTGNVSAIVSTRTGAVQRDVLTWRGGETTEAWWTKGDYLAEDPRTGNMLFTPAKKSLGKLGWIAWVSEKNYQGVETHDGMKALVFRDDVPWLEYWPGFFTGDREGGSRTPLGAWFSLEDGRLLGLKVGEIALKFSWLPAPEKDLTVTEKFTEKQQKIRARIAKKFPRASTP